MSAYPFYYKESPRLINCVSDQVLTLAAPIIFYWVYALFFLFLDTRQWGWLRKYRFHESPEVTSRNSPTLTRVFFAVVLQQVIQTALGLLWLQGERISNVTNHQLAIQNISLSINAPDDTAAYFIYWYGLPAVQFVIAMFIMDTWFYFGHRLLHLNEYLYKNVHSVHHRLYVPYAIGALYNHPVEAFFLDTLGAAIAEALTGMTTRQAMALFTLATLKAVDDHCGYSLPFDPFQMLGTNTAEYHDIHHQKFGFKSNFSQPFFVHWDTLMGTRMTRRDIERRRAERKAKKASNST